LSKDSLSMVEKVFMTMLNKYPSRINWKANRIAKEVGMTSMQASSVLKILVGMGVVESVKFNSGKCVYKINFEAVNKLKSDRRLDDVGSK